MSYTVDSQFLSVLLPQPDISSGWSLRVLDYKDMHSTVAVVSEFTAMSFTQELNGTGTGSITLDEDSPFWTAILNAHVGDHTSNRVLLNNEYIWEAWENNTPRFAWVAQTVENFLVGEDETRTVTISGPGIAQVLTWACVNRPGWPNAIPLTVKVPKVDNPSIITYLPRYFSGQDSLPASAWQFPIAWSSMRIWFTIFKAAQRRGLLGWVTPLFTAVKDSAGHAWVTYKTEDEVAENLGYRPPTLGENLLDFLNDMTGQDYSVWGSQRLEWIMHPGFKLDVRPTIGSDKSANVRFFQGNLLSDSRTRDRENIFNRIIMVDVNGDETSTVDAKSIQQWNTREQWNETNKNITIPSQKAYIGERYRQQYRDEKDQYAITIPYDDPGRQPYRDFTVGDYIGLSVDYFGSTPTAVAAPDKYRVMAITISITADSTVPECELTLKSLIDLRMDELQKQITKLINDPANFDIGTIKQISGSLSDNTTPDGSVLVYNAKTGKWEAGTAATGGSGTMFVQATDPASVAGTVINAGDFWLETYD